MFQSFVRALSLSSALYAGATLAQEDNPELHSSAEMAARLAPISDLFLETAQKDVVVLSQEDLFPDDAFMQRRIRMAQEMDVPYEAFLRSQDYLPIIRSLKAEHRIGSDIRGDNLSPIEYHLENLFDTMLFERLYYNVAAASRIPMQGEDAPVCLITSPTAQSEASAILSALAHLPARQHAEIDERITYEDIYQYIMFHEAAHCAQDFHEASPPPEDWQEYQTWEIENDIEANMHSLNKETEADEVALERMRQILSRDGRPEELAEIIGDVVKDSRAIGALRVGADIFNAPEQYPRHATHVHNGELPFDYNEADVFLAVKTVTTLVNLTIGYNYGTLTAFSNNSALKHEGDYMLIMSPEDATAAGFAIAHEIPEVQYGTMKAMLEIAQNPEIRSVFEGTSDYIETAFQLSKNMIANYLQAMEEYHPTIAYSSLAQDSYDQLITLANNIDLNANNERPESAPAPAEDPNDPFVLFMNSLEAPTNAQEALVMMRRVVDFYEGYKMHLEIEHQREMEKILNPQGRSPMPPSPPAFPAPKN